MEEFFNVELTQLGEVGVRRVLIVDEILIVVLKVGELIRIVLVGNHFVLFE
jgi:hypothetical protein